jgi:hypothetical protein
VFVQAAEIPDFDRELKKRVVLVEHSVGGLLDWDGQTRKRLAKNGAVHPLVIRQVVVRASLNDR